MTLKTRLGTRRKSGISPVIATIILIAITIVIAVAVAGWVFGLFGSYSKNQPLSILAASSTCTSSGSGSCTITLQNTAGNSISVISASINGKPATLGGTTVVSAGSTAAVALSGVTITSGDTYNIELGLSNGGTLVTTIVAS